jgi:hypothetical protein
VAATQGFTEAGEALRAVDAASGAIDAIVVATASAAADRSVDGWRRILAEHDGIVEQIHADAGWARAAATYAAERARPVRLVTLVDATTAGGRSRAQAAAQLSRVSGATTEGRVSAFVLSVEVSTDKAGRSLGALVSHLLGHPGAGALSGAELAVGDGWVGLRSHPRVLGTVIYGGPAVPDWFDAALRDIVGTGDVLRPLDGS